MLLFICLPLLICTALLAIWLHFRQKRRRASQAPPNVQVNQSSIISSQDLSLSVTVSPLAQEDKIGLIRECRIQLRKSRAKFLALKSDFTVVIKNLTATGLSKFSNDKNMQNLDEKIGVYEKQITDLQNKLEVLETIVPAQDEAWHLRQAIKEKDTEIGLLKSNAVKHESTSIAPIEQVNEEAVVLQKTVEQLKEENAGLLKKIKEQEIELALKKRLLDNIYHELDAFTTNKTGKTAAQTFL